MKKIWEIAEKVGIPEDKLKPYGYYMAKISHNFLDELREKEDGNLIVVTAMTPTPTGEGKTTVSIGLSMALNRLSKKTIVTLREPSLGPIMGMKGGATGGGKSKVLPSEEINLFFTGDIPAVCSAHNLISAMLDASIKFGNKLGIDTTRIMWPRTLDMNDRALRNIVVALGGRANGVPREDSFVITAASEIMAILALAKDISDLKERISRIVVARDLKGKPITVGDLKATGAVSVLLKDAINPNLVQTTEETPAIIHAGPFANIAHGTNSLLATKLALKLADFVVTETGFGADLGAEKFLDFVAFTGDLKVSAMVIIATVKSLKYHGGKDLKSITEEDFNALKKGLENLRVHVENMKKFGMEVVVALNRFPDDTEKELEYTIDMVEKELNVPIALTEVYSKGGEGGIDLAQKVIDVAQPKKPNRIYNEEDPVDVKVEKLAKEIYRASKVEFLSAAKTKLKFFKKYGYDKLPVIVAKTQYSISDDPKKLNAPSDYTFTVRDFELSAGAGFVVALAGEIMRMPGLPKEPNAYNFDLSENGEIIGSFGG